MKGCERVDLIPRIFHSSDGFCEEEKSWISGSLGLEDTDDEYRVYGKVQSFG